MIEVQPFFDADTSTLSYVAYDPIERVAVVIDPVLDYDPASGGISTHSADRIAGFIDATGLRLPYVFDTHAHADHLTALAYLASRYDARTVTGAAIARVQDTFTGLLGLDPEVATGGRPFDVLLVDDETLDVGPFEVRALHTPGHTPACMTWAIADALFVGDTLFQPDYGTARCDFPAGSAEVLYDSVQRLYRSFPDTTRVFTGHDYQPGGRPLRFESRLGEQRTSNRQLRQSTSREAFAALRRARDAELGMPALMWPSVQVNIRAGRLPSAEANGVSYLKVPVHLKGGPPCARPSPS